MAISSEVAICNLALLKLGDNPITSLEDGTTASNACALVYNQTRDSLLRRHFWNFSLKRVALAADVSAPAFRFNYQYTLPSDFIRVQEIFQQNSDYVIEGTKLLTDDTAPLKMRYVSRVTDTSLFDPLFVDALVLLIVIKIGARIQGDAFDPRASAQELQQVLLEAKMVDAQDGSPQQLQINTFTNSRQNRTTNNYGSYSWIDY